MFFPPSLLELLMAVRGARHAGTKRKGKQAALQALHSHSGCMAGVRKCGQSEPTLATLCEPDVGAVRDVRDVA